MDVWLKSHADSFNSARSLAKVCLFNLQENILIGNDINDKSADSVAVTKPSASSTLDHTTTIRGLTCRACGLIFEKLEDQFVHFKSEEHRLNLQRNLKSVSEGDPPMLSRMNIAGNDDGSDGGDESEEEADELNDIHEDENILSRMATSSSQAKSAYGTCTQSFSASTGPSLTFQRHAEDSWSFSLSSSILDYPLTDECVADPWDVLRLTIRKISLTGKMWAVMVLRSGKFVGVIFDGMEVIAHKSFRRYTVRAKQGGGQSSHDNQGNKAISAGAMLRRYGEQALKEDIHELLRLWSAHLQTCANIFLSTPKTMRGILFDEKISRDPPLRKNDPRIRSVPFMVQKCTMEEAIAIHAKLTTVIFRKVAGGDIANPASSAGALELPNKTNSSSIVGKDIRHTANMKQRQHEDTKSSVGAASSSQQLLALSLPRCAESVALIEACVRGDADAADAILKRLSQHPAAEECSSSSVSQSLSSTSDTPAMVHTDVGCDTVNDGREWDLRSVLDLPDNLQDLKTPLHIASELGHVPLVSLLLKYGADPCRKDIRDRPAYFLCRDKPTRDAFRKSRGDMETVLSAEAEGDLEVESKFKTVWDWDWDAAGVPTGITNDSERSQREKEKEKKRRAKLRKKEQQERDEAARAIAVKAAAESEQKRKHDTDAARTHAVSVAGLCAGCGVSLFGVKPLLMLDTKSCSSACVLVVRRRLTAEAAMARLNANKS